MLKGVKNRRRKILEILISGETKLMETALIKATVFKLSSFPLFVKKKMTGCPLEIKIDNGRRVKQETPRRPINFPGQEFFLGFFSLFSAFWAF